jgi:tRNA (guanine10-N2)-dimethyltransferase
VYCLEFAGEDDAFAASEARTAAAGLERVGPGLAVAGSLDPGRARTLAFTRRCSRLLGRTDADVTSARALLSAAPPGGGPVPGSDTVRVRARDVRGTAGVSTAEAERELGAVLVERGFEVDLDDPDHELRVFFSAGDVEGPAPADPLVDDEVAGVTASGGDDGGVGPGGGPTAGGDGVCLLGWTAAESRRDFGTRRPTDRPFFQPGSMAPLDARAVANLAGARPGALVADPMCGTAGVLVEAGLVGARVLGLDAQAKMVRGARENLAASLDGGYALARADATRLPVRDDALAGIAFDAPYGRQSKVARHGLSDLVAGALAEAARVAPRAVVVADRSWRTAAREAGWRVVTVHERRVHRSLTRHYHLLVRG